MAMSVKLKNLLSYLDLGICRYVAKVIDEKQSQFEIHNLKNH